MKGKKTGGRSKGTPNRATIAKQVEAASVVKEAYGEGITPLQYMLKVLRDEDRDHVDRYRAAVDAAPYLHPRLATTTLEGGDKPIGIEHLLTAIDGKTRRIPSTGD